MNTKERLGKGQRNRRATKEQQKHLISGVLLACSALQPAEQEWELLLLPDPAQKLSWGPTKG